MSNNVSNYNNNNINNTVTKANVIQLKLFDQMMDQKQQQAQSLLLSRENSMVYSQQIKLSGNGGEQQLNSGDILGDLLTKDLLQIKQLNRKLDERNNFEIIYR